MSRYRTLISHYSATSRLSDESLDQARFIPELRGWKQVDVYHVAISEDNVNVYNIVVVWAARLVVVWEGTIRIHLVIILTLRFGPRIPGA